jgi:hypothetical protein
MSMETQATIPEVLVTGIGSRPSVPVWASGSGTKPELVSNEEIEQRDLLPDLLIVRAETPKVFLEHHRFVAVLARKQQEASGPAIILIEFKKTGRAYEPEVLAEVLRAFRERADVRLVVEPGQAKGAFVDAIVQVIARKGKPTESHMQQDADPFAKVKEIVDATADLRTERGNLSAARIADTFEISVAELAKLVGKTRQAVSQRDDSKSIQKALLPFERVARLRSVLGENFKKWLRIPNRRFADKAPLDVILAGKVKIAAELVEDMLTGTPS